MPLPQLKCAYQEGGCSIVLFCGSEESRLSALSVALPLLSFRCHACYRAGPSVPLGVLHRVARRSISGFLTECGRRLGFPRPSPCWFAAAMQASLKKAVLLRKVRTAVVVSVNGLGHTSVVHHTSVLQDEALRL